LRLHCKNLAKPELKLPKKKVNDMDKQIRKAKMKTDKEFKKLEKEDKVRDKKCDMAMDKKKMKGKK